MKIVSVFIGVLALFIIWKVENNPDELHSLGFESISYIKDINVEENASSTPEIKKASHIKTPDHVKAIYMSSWVAGAPTIRARLVNMIDQSELNAVVIDVKDNQGGITWISRAKDINNFIEELHKKNIYVIGRVASFQDPEYVKEHPEQAVQSIKTGTVWKDHKGVPWVDTGDVEMWKYLSDIGHQAYDRGFDEINFDYIRFPTDGDLSSMRFPISKDEGLNNKELIVRHFYEFLHADFSKDNIPISGDVFGIITTNANETKTLGQDLHDALNNFDFVAPMVYPSHFYAGTDGFQNPAEHPKEIIDYAMSGAVKLANETALSFAPVKYIQVGTSTQAVKETVMSTSTQILADKFISKLRPWYQDFDMGAVYTKEMVRAQIDAGYNLGVNSWMLWDPANHYTPSALKNE